MRTSDLVRLCGIYMGVMLQRVPKVLVYIMSFKINSKLLPQVPGTNQFKKIDIFQRYVSDIFTHYQWLKYKHPEDLTKYSFASIPALFLLVLAYCDIQGFYHRPLHIVFGGCINCHKTIQRISKSTQRILCGHKKNNQNINHMRLPSMFRICTNVQCGAVKTRSIFSNILTTDTP